MAHQTGGKFAELNQILLKNNKTYWNTDCPFENMSDCLRAVKNLNSYAQDGFPKTISFDRANKPNVLPLGVHEARWVPISKLNLTAPAS